MTAFTLRSVIVAAVVFFLTGVVTSLAIRSPGESTRPVASTREGVTVRHRWRVPLSVVRNLPGGETLQWLEKAVIEASGGAFVIDLFDPGEIVPAFAITDAVRDRKVEAGITWLGYDQGKIPASALIAAKPFGMPPWAYVGWWYHSDGRKLTEAIYARHNMMPLLCGISGAETAGWFREPLESIDDLSGLKIRFAGLGGKALQRVGASVTMLPPGDIFQALETGVIDATEYGQPVVDQALGFARIAKYNYFPGWHQPFSATHLVVNLEVWRALPASDRALLDGLCTSAVTFSLGLSETLQGPVVAGFKDQGVTAQLLPDDMLAALARAVDEVLEEEAAADDDFASILASQRAFHDMYRKWYRLAYISRDFD